MFWFNGCPVIRFTVADRSCVETNECFAVLEVPHIRDIGNILRSGEVAFKFAMASLRLARTTQKNRNDVNFSDVPFFY